MHSGFVAKYLGSHTNTCACACACALTMTAPTTTSTEAEAEAPAHVFTHDDALQYHNYGTGEVAYREEYEAALNDIIRMLNGIVARTEVMDHVPAQLRTAAAFTAHVMSFEGPMQGECTGCVHETCVDNLTHLHHTMRDTIMRRRITMEGLYNVVRLALIYTFPFLPVRERDVGEALYWALEAAVPREHRSGVWFGDEDHEHVPLRTLGYVGSN
jgi:hypothetical protein